MALSEEQFLLILKMKSELGAIIKQDSGVVQRETRKMDGSLDRVRRGLGDVARAGRSVFRTLTPGWRTLTASVLSVAAAQRAAARSSDFRLGMAEVATIAPEAAGGVSELSREVLALSVAQNKLEGDVTKGLYDTISAGFNKAGTAMAVLASSTDLATAGVASTGESVDLTTTSLNAYNMAADQAGRVTDVWFTTVRQGKTTIPELAGAVGRVIPLAATLGVEIEELGAAIATATAQGQDTRLATTNQLALLKQLLVRQSEVNAIFERSNQTYDINTLATKGLSHVVKVLGDNTKDTTEVQEVLGGQIEALNGFLAISGANFRTFQSNLDATRHSAGNVSRALEKIRGTDAFKVQQAIRAMKVETIAFGDAINSSLVDGIEQFGGLEAVQQAVRNGLSGLIPVMEKLVGLGATWLGDFKEFVPNADLATAKAQLFLLKAEEVASTLAGLVPGGATALRYTGETKSDLRDAIAGGGVSTQVRLAYPGRFDQQLAKIDELDAAINAARNATMDQRPTVNMGGIGRLGRDPNAVAREAAARLELDLVRQRAEAEREISDLAKEALDFAHQRERDLAEAQRQRIKLQREAEKRVAELTRQAANERRRLIASGGGMPLNVNHGNNFGDMGGLPMAAAGFGNPGGMLGGGVTAGSVLPDPGVAQEALKIMERAREIDQQRKLIAGEDKLKREEAARSQLEFAMQLHELQLQGASTDEERLEIARKLHEVRRQILFRQAKADDRTPEEIQQLLDAFKELGPDSDKAKQSLEELEDKFKELKGSLQQAASSNLADFFVDFASGAVKGKEAMSEFARSMLADIGRIMAQRAALNIIGSAGTKEDAGTGLLGLLFAKGGVGPAGMGATRPLPVHAYSAGGVASSPQVGIFGEGRTREAFVPLPDNRTIPVTLKGEGGGGASIQINMPVSAVDSRSFDEGIEQRSAAIARALARELKGNALLRGHVRRVASGRG